MPLFDKKKKILIHTILEASENLLNDFCSDFVQLTLLDWNIPRDIDVRNPVHFK